MSTLAVTLSRRRQWPPPRATIRRQVALQYSNTKEKMSGRTFRYNNTFKRRAWDSLVNTEEEEDENPDDEEEEESLYFAICEDDEVGLARMLKEGLNPNFKFNGENQLAKTVLHLCCEKGLTGCAALLMEQGARLNTIDAWSQTPLMYAVCTERLEMVRMMVDACADLNKRDRFGEAVLHYSVKHETTDCMKVLIEGGAYINIPDNLKRTPLWDAAAKDGYEEAMKCLIEYGADVTKRDCREKRSPLQFIGVVRSYSCLVWGVGGSNIGDTITCEAALAHTNKDTIVYLNHLIQAGAPVNGTDEFGHSCVMTMLRRCYMNNRDFTDEDKEKVHILLKAGHDIDLVCEVVNPALWYRYHDTALNLAISKNLPCAVSFLLDVGADPNKYSGIKLRGNPSEPPLITVARENRLDLARLLLQSGCNMAARAPEPITGAVLSTPALPPPISQPTAFRIAVEQEYWEFTELLLQAGYDLKPERYLWTNQNVPDQLVLNLDLWSRLLEHVAVPPPLVVHCRNRVRAHLGWKLQRKVAELPLPMFLKDVLLLRHL